MDWLSEGDAERVMKANILYEFVAKTCRELSLEGISWSIENPANSLFWKTKHIAV